MEGQGPPPTRGLDEIRERLSGQDTVGITEELSRMEPVERASAFRLLPKDRALAVFQSLDAVHQEELLEYLRGEQIRELFEGMEPDDRVRLLEEMPATVVKHLLTGLSPRERRLTGILLGYPPESAGRIMSPELIRLRPSMTVQEAMERVRRRGRFAETVYVLPVTDDELRFVGTVELRDLVLADPASRVEDIMDKEARAVRVDEDQEDVARLIQATDALAVPVVDTEGRLVGLVTVDDAMDIVDIEEREDFARLGAAEPLGRPYFSATVFHLARSRALFLVALILPATLTVTVLGAFEDMLESLVILTLFIPLLIGTGGNCGAQAVTTIVRAMAVDEVRFGDLFRVISREAMTGLLLGMMLAALGFLPLNLFAGYAIAVVVALTLVAVCTLASLTGSVIPILADRVGVDPAVASAPFVATFIDAAGLLVYFLIARLVLGI
jgi:magnesium transporter